MTHRRLVFSLLMFSAAACGRSHPGAENENPSTSQSPDKSEPTTAGSKSNGGIGSDDNGRPNQTKPSPGEPSANHPGAKNESPSADQSPDKSEPTTPGSKPNGGSGPGEKGKPNQTNPSPEVPNAGDLARIERSKSCVTARAASAIPLIVPAKTEARRVPDADFLAIKETMKSACTGCHGAPTAKSGGFSYVNSYAGSTLNVAGSSVYFPGLAESAEKIHNAVAEDIMPPAAFRRANPQAFTRLAAQLKTWIDNGLPQEQVISAGNVSSLLGLTDPSKFTDLGDCLPVASSVGSDVDKDTYFSKAVTLPDDLKSTDFLSFDAADLAHHGTVAYDVEYPLWTDNAGKSRLIHLPHGRQRPSPTCTL